MERLRTWWVASAGAVAAAATYGHTLRFGLWWDDYHALRPWTWAEIARTWHGTWDPFGVWPVFFRPLSTSYYALAFSLAGVNGWLLHALSIGLLALVAALVGVWVARESQSTPLALFAAALYASHPAIAQAEGPWFFLGTHTLCSLIVAAALLVWQRRRAMPTIRAWRPLGALVAVGFLIQEDVIMLAPALVALQTVRARTGRDVPAPSRSLWIAMGALVCGLFVGRLAVLGAIGGRGTPDAGEMALNLVRAVVRVLFVFERQHLPVNAVASLVSSIALIGGMVLMLRRPGVPPVCRRLAETGAVLFAVFVLPLLLLSSPSRYHLLALGGVLMLTGACRAWVEVGARRPAPAVAAALGVLVIASFSFASRAAIAPFAPCAPERLGTDTDVLLWPPIAPDVRAWLEADPQACARGDARTIVESAAALRWDTQAAGGPVVVLVSNEGRAAAITIADRRAAASTPLAVSLAVDGDVHHAVVPAGSQVVVEVPLVRTWRSWVRAMHRLDIAPEDRAAAGPAIEVSGVEVLR